ncbi:hypothetical protein COLU111180_01620 [Cohnella lubricantis]|nr:hypothetical protein [Cohnella lubricantis]
MQVIYAKARMERDYRVYGNYEFPASSGTYELDLSRI